YGILFLACAIDIPANVNIESLVVDVNYNFFVPVRIGHRTVELAPGTQFWIACPGGQLTDGQINLRADGELMTCQGGRDIITANGRPTNYNNIACNHVPRIPQLTESYVIGKTLCERDNIAITVTYNVNYTSVDVITICFDVNALNPVYTREQLTRWARETVNAQPRPRFKNSMIYGAININNIYTNMDAILTNLGVNLSGNTFSKGHLAPRADFLYKFQRDATFFYPNVAPQILEFNRGNWEILENAIAVITQTGFYGDATVLTGTLNVLNVAQNGTVAPLYLVPNTHQIPVPEYFWKFVFYPNVGVAQVFFGLNNPIPDADQGQRFETQICPNVFQNIQADWQLGQINNNNPVRGIIYACDVVTIIDPLIREITTNVLNEFGVTASQLSTKNLNRRYGNKNIQRKQNYSDRLNSLAQSIFLKV
ncbi:uncharacterized protein LOC135138000, partial [Zophobas morio]|uniref:uncharacterized protein LOC135138000 n=1 Tax=Zophobas morio TaxID=2755281 RepID=UPI0030838D7F